MKRAFEVEQKIFFFVSQVASFRLTKQTSKNVADTTFKYLENEKSFSNDINSIFHHF